MTILKNTIFVLLLFTFSCKGSFKKINPTPDQKGIVVDKFYEEARKETYSHYNSSLKKIDVETAYDDEDFVLIIYFESEKIIRRFEVSEPDYNSIKIGDGFILQ